MKRKRNIVIATVAAAAVVCGGTAAAFADADGGRDDRDAQAQVRQAKVTATQAIDAALKAQPGTVVSADLDMDDTDDDRDRDRDDRGWEVDILGQGTTSYTVHVDATTGKVLGTETDKDDAQDKAQDKKDDAAADSDNDNDSGDSADD
ncbi:PepSY domain-containing protein [Streptomyces sp. NPDC015346]|uniref:PepSY domain-containing protein n=1 Tax=Streptomyces sp. NPDC015346 TaxID=3364954 RepID=UPI0036F73489